MRRWLHVLWAEARRQPLQSIAGGLVLIASVLASGSTVAALKAQRDADRALTELEHETDRREAIRCVDSWTAREDVRDAVEKGTRGGAEVGASALLGVATDPDPDDVARYQALIDQLADAKVAEARAEVPDPDCDLADARSRLNQER